jgi:hypothetical protein
MDEGLAGLAAGDRFSEPAVALGRAVKGVEQLEAPWEPHAAPVELLTPVRRPGQGVPVRATVSGFEAPLLGKVLDCNDVQASVQPGDRVQLVFHRGARRRDDATTFSFEAWSPSTITRTSRPGARCSRTWCAAG